MYVCMYVCMYVYMYVCMYVCMIVWLYAYRFVCLSVCLLFSIICIQDKKLTETSYFLSACLVSCIAIRKRSEDIMTSEEDPLKSGVH